MCVWGGVGVGVGGRMDRVLLKKASIDCVNHFTYEIIHFFKFWLIVRQIHILSVLTQIG